MVYEVVQCLAVTKVMYSGLSGLLFSYFCCADSNEKTNKKTPFAEGAHINWLFAIHFTFIICEQPQNYKIGVFIMEKSIDVVFLKEVLFTAKLSAERSVIYMQDKIAEYGNDTHLQEFFTLQLEDREAFLNKINEKIAEIDNIKFNIMGEQL